MAQPSRLIYRKPHLTSCSGKAKGCKKVDFGEFGLMCINGKGMTKDLQQRTGNWVTEKQIEAVRVVISKYCHLYSKQGAKMWIRIFPQLTVTKKPIGVRGGSGKGSPDRFVAVVKQGTVMFEVANIPESEARECLRKAGAKLNVCTKVIKKGERGLYE